jgi:hypothetical protein
MLLDPMGMVLLGRKLTSKLDETRNSETWLSASLGRPCLFHKLSSLKAISGGGNCFTSLQTSIQGLLHSQIRVLLGETGSTMLRLGHSLVPTIG